jgi:hypothetical protein
MTCPFNITIRQGKTLTLVVRFEALPYLYKAITAITKAAPAVLTVTGHGIPDGWRVAPVSVQGMTEINAKLDGQKRPRLDSYVKATVVDANTISLNEVNSSDFSTYTTGGYLQLFTPVNITGYLARMTVRNKVGGTALLTLTSPADIVLDTTKRTFTITVPAATTALMTWRSGVYDFEVEAPDGTVTELLSGNVTVIPEVTT